MEFKGRGCSRVRYCNAPSANTSPDDTQSINQVESPEKQTAGPWLMLFGPSIQGRPASAHQSSAGPL